MRYTILLVLLSSLLFSNTALAQKKSKSNTALQPKNCIQLDSSTFIGQTEITNKMYREFVHFVRDSIITHLLYDSLPEAQAAQLLNVSKKELKNLRPKNRLENAGKYSLNYTAYITKFINEDSLAIEILNRHVYYPPVARFYVRREIDVRKLIYRLNEMGSVAVFPDTLSWNADYYVKYKDLIDTTKIIAYPTNSYVNMYYWHPGYDNYPVVGLNLSQMLAFCHWYEREMNKNKPD